MSNVCVLTHSVVSYSLWLRGVHIAHQTPLFMGILQARILEWGIFPTQGSNPGPLHCRRTLCHLSHRGSPRIFEWVAYPFSRGYSQPRSWTMVSSTAGQIFTSWTTREDQNKQQKSLILKEAAKEEGHRTKQKTGKVLVGTWWWGSQGEIACSTTYRLEELMMFPAQLPGSCVPDCASQGLSLTETSLPTWPGSRPRGAACLQRTLTRIPRGSVVPL